MHLPMNNKSYVGYHFTVVNRIIYLFIYLTILRIHRFYVCCFLFMR